MNRDYHSDPRTCTECRQDLFPNFMEGRWEHFAKGCKYSGMSAASVAEGTEIVPAYYKDEKKMIGPWKSDLPPAASASSENDSVVAARNPKETPEIYIDLDEYQ